MDKKEIVKRWEQVGPVADGPIPSYQAKGPEGQFVQVHWIPQNHQDYQRLLSLVGTVQAHPPAGLVETTGVDGGLVVVTHILPGQVTLDGWLAEYAAGLETPPTPAPSGGASQAPPENEDYSALFRIPDEGQGSPSTPDPQTPKTPSPEDPAPGPVQSGPTEGPPIGQSYTALFEAPSPNKEVKPQTPAGDPSPQPTPPPPKPEPQADDNRGFAPPWEETKTQPPEPQETPVPSGDGASITDMFQRPRTPPPPPPSRKPDRWTEPEKGLPLLQLSLGDYLRRLKGSN